MPPRSKPPLERFILKFEQPEQGCWLWKGHLLSTGYALFYNGIKQVSAHRFSYETRFGPIPTGLCVLHRCDVRHCVRPDHLFLGTYKDNGQDMARKDRSLHGTRNNKAKFDEKTIRLIRKEFSQGKSLNQVAKERGLNLKTAQDIRRGKTWKRAGGPIFPDKMTPQMFAGSNNGRAVLTEASVQIIREQAAAGTKVKELAKRFSVTRKAVENLIHGLTWKHAPGPISPRQPIAECIGENLPGAKLTEAIVRTARQRFAKGESGRKLASEYGVNSATMYTMLRGETWKHVT